MRGIKNVALSEVIVHILPKEGDPELSQLPIPAGSDPQIFQYFERHIRSSLSDGGARAARFEKPPEEPASICQGILEGGDLVAGSQRLARRLHGIMKQDGRISAGDLAVCTFEGKLDGKTQRFLAIMKIDPTTALRQKREEVGGQLLITFEVEQQMLPTEGEQLQKAAFVRRLDPRPAYDILLIDRQVKPPEGPQIAQFFSQDFLGAVEAMSSEEATRALLPTLQVLKDVFKQEVQKQKLEPKEADGFDRAVDGLKSSKRVDLDNWVATLTLPAPAQARVARSLSSGRFPSRQITVSSKVVAAWKAKPRVFVGDFGLRVEIPPDLLKHQFQVSYPKRKPGWFGGRDYYEVTLRTETWGARP